MSLSVVDPIIWHADRLEPLDPVDRIDGDDVGVLKLGEHPRLVVESRRDLENDGPIRQVTLASEIDLAESPSAKLVDQPKSDEILARRG